MQLKNAISQRPPPVELTKVHYHDRNLGHRNAEIATVSGAMFANKHSIIRKNIFGHKWVLKVNETEDDGPKRRSKWKLIVYVVVFSCIVIAVCFGVYFSLDTKPAETNAFDSVPEVSIEESATTKPVTLQTKTNDDATTKKVHKREICNDCRRPSHICLKLAELEKPKCVLAVDIRDPTGCGGHCKVNTQYCKLLDVESHVHQCIDIRNALICRKNMFNCGNMCVPLAKRCDGIFHCSNYSDEKDCACDLTTHFHCGYATSCLELPKRCDGKIDCWDKSDERNCGKRCNEDELPCTDGQCIKKDNFCDGTYHCEDKSDEPHGCQK